MKFIFWTEFFSINKKICKDKIEGMGQTLFRSETSYLVAKDAFNFSDISDDSVKESKIKKSFNGLCFLTMPTSVGEVNKKSGPG